MFISDGSFMSFSLTISSTFTLYCSAISYKLSPDLTICVNGASSNVPATAGVVPVIVFIILFSTLAGLCSTGNDPCKSSF